MAPKGRPRLVARLPRARFTCRRSNRPPVPRFRTKNVDQPSYGDNLARLREALATGRLPQDVGVWVLDVATCAMPKSERAEQRNRYLRAAAALLAGSVEAKARRLRIEALDLTRGWHRHGLEPPDLSSARGLVQAALQVDLDTP